MDQSCRTPPAPRPPSPRFCPHVNRTVIGVAPQTDILTASAQRARRFLLSAGAALVVDARTVTAAGVDELHSALALAVMFP
ncbi:hypothetical protein DDIC_08825 [Desulfovibrio desulfuricans]|uniref:Uncharacterized protein n=1 Tax=Desulfovibrio desulfuricans TaxID=876 RepID=A0A4P7UI04_DESDE|nr:hypothetical protein DDIC_08825 [Desulfovibrio desulfuricans]